MPPVPAYLIAPSLAGRLLMAVGVALASLLPAGSVSAASFIVSSPVDAPDAVPGDGICATALALLILRELGAEAEWHLPSRFEEGYGVSSETLARVRSMHAASVRHGVMLSTQNASPPGSGARSRKSI